jgi:hypothetical protein
MPADKQNRSKLALTVRPGSLVVWLVMLLLATVGHADTGGIHYDHWQDTNGWHGQTRSQGSTTDWDACGPNGQQRHCHRYYVGDTAYTNCN